MKLENKDNHILYINVLLKSIWTTKIKKRNSWYQLQNAKHHSTVFCWRIIGALILLL